MRVHVVSFLALLVCASLGWAAEPKGTAKTATKGRKALAPPPNPAQGFGGDPYRVVALASKAEIKASEAIRHRQKVGLLPLPVPQLTDLEKREQRRVAGQHPEIAVRSRDLHFIDRDVDEHPVGRDDLQLDVRGQRHQAACRLPNRSITSSIVPALKKSALTPRFKVHFPRVHLSCA